MPSQWKRYPKKINNAWRSIAKNLALGYPNKRTWREWGHIEMSPILNDKITTGIEIYRLFIFQTFTLKRHDSIKFFFNLMYFKSDDQKHTHMQNSNFSWFFSKKCIAWFISALNKLILICQIQKSTGRSWMINVKNFTYSIYVLGFKSAILQ